MHTLWFWKNWPRGERKLFWLLASLGFASIFILCFVYFQNPSLAFIWEQFQTIELLEIPSRTFSMGLSSVDVPIDNLLLFETFSGSALQPTAWIFYIFLGCVSIGFLLYTTFITTLKRYSFLVGVGFLILAIVSFRWEALELFGLTNKFTSAVIVVLFGGTAYFFQSIRTHHSFNFRLSVFTGIATVIGIIIFLFSHITEPFLHLAANAITISIVMSIYFILMVAHEIVASFVSIVTNSRDASKSALHFFVIFMIYFANLIITYLIREQYIYWDIFTVNSFFLLTISAVIGIWGLLKREPLYADAIENPAHPILLYLGFFLTTFATVSLGIATDSTTLVETFNDIILFSHLGYGIIFFSYTLSNFGPMLLANLPVHKILYKPDTMPFMTFRIMSLIATFAFLSFSSPLTTYFDRVTAAYHNAQGDIYLSHGDQTTAEAYYRKSILYRNQNHHAHYALATMYAEQLDPNRELKEYETIINTSPTEISYLNLADITGLNGNYVRTQEVLTDGLKIFKKSGVLANAQALNYYQIGLLDSSLSYFQKARNVTLTKATAETNLFATSAKLDLKFPADSLLKLLGSDDIGAQSNALALANVQHLPLDVRPSLSKDTVLNVKMATLLCNQLTNQRNKIDTALLAPIISLARKSVNENFKEYLLVAAAQSYYQHDMIKKAFDLVREMAYSTDKGKYFNLLAIWFLEQDEPNTAAGYFKKANEKRIKGANFLEALSYTEADSAKNALPIWRALIQSNDSLISNEAKVYLKILEQPVSPFQLLNDMEKYGVCNYRIPLNDSSLFMQVAQSIVDEDGRAKAILARSKRWLALDEVNLAADYMNLLRGMKLRDKSLAENILAHTLILNAKLSNWALIESQLEKMPEIFINEKIYLQALVAERQNKSADAKKKFEYLASANFLFTDGLLASAKYFEKNSTDKLKAYSILVNGLLANSNSVPLLKEYIKVSANLGFDEEVRQTLEKLKLLISSKAFTKYITTNNLVDEKPNHLR